MQHTRHPESPLQCGVFDVGTGKLMSMHTVPSLNKHHELMLLRVKLLAQFKTAWHQIFAVPSCMKLVVGSCKLCPAASAYLGMWSDRN